MKKGYIRTPIALVTVASSRFGRMISRDLAAAGHTVYAKLPARQPSL